jgi:hypothetical protein
MKTLVWKQVRMVGYVREGEGAGGKGLGDYL